MWKNLAKGDIFSRILNSVISERNKIRYNGQHSMDWQSGFGLIYQFTGGEKAVESRKIHLVVLMRGFSGALNY